MMPNGPGTTWPPAPPSPCWANAVRTPPSASCSAPRTARRSPRPPWSGSARPAPPRGRRARSSCSPAACPSREAPPRSCSTRSQNESSAYPGDRAPMMDFTLPERSQAVADLAAEVLRGEDPWKELAQAGLLDESPPDRLSVLEVSVLLTEIGRRAPSMQPLATLMTGALPLARRGHADLAPGEPVTAALREHGHPTPTTPATAVTHGQSPALKIGDPSDTKPHPSLVLLC